MALASALLTPFISPKCLVVAAVLGCCLTLCATPTSAETKLDLTKATVVIRPGEREPAEAAAPTVLVEEVEKRTGLRWPVAAQWPAKGTIIALTQRVDAPWGAPLPARTGADLPETRAEGFRVFVEQSGEGRAVVWVIGGDARGVLYGVGHLLRHLEWADGTARIDTDLDAATAPVYPIRGHQLGYRNTANSYDAWDVAAYGQYIRELAIFGANCVENIPNQGADSPHMPLPRAEMNAKIAEICQRYGMDHWVWIPADFDLTDAKRRAQALDALEAQFAGWARLDAVFIPGGDPGDNPADLLVAYAADMAERMNKHHPKAKIWISLQGFDKEQTGAFHRYVDEHLPEWLAGLVAGPSSPPIAETRNRLPERYRLRHYPDITHSLVCQYPVYWWDQAFASTLGREGPNPQPAWYTHVHNWFAGYTDGFLTYSDGMHDDVNKAVWSRVGWDPSTPPRQTMIEYARFFFGPGVAEQAADAILALEKNWEGVLANNGAVDATLTQWQSLEREAPQLKDNWRWQLCLLRAYYDAYTRHRQIYENALERQANEALASAPDAGAQAAMDTALAILARAESAPCRPEWRARIEALCVSLFDLIGYQTSVERYQARNGERGAILDYVDVPLNNRWWLEDELARIKDMPTEAEKLARLEVIRTWEDPGPGGFYDDIGNVAKMAHLTLPPGPWVDPDLVEMRNPHFPWTGNGYSRQRRSWLSLMRWPESLVYRGLDPNARYIVRATGRGDLRPRVNGELLEPSLYSRDNGEFKEFPVPPRLVKDRILTLTFDDIDEYHLNWRQWSYLAEVWLLKQGK